MILNQRLKSLRVQNNVTQQKVADALGVTVGNVQKFEYGTAKPKLENVIKLANFFNVSLDYLVGRTDNPKVVGNEVIRERGNENSANLLPY